MGLFGDAVGNVIFRYKADISDAQKNLRTLSGEQKKAAQEVVQGLKDQQEHYDLMATRIAKVTAVTAGLVAVGVAGFKKYEEASRLSAATAGVSLDKLRAATRGLVTDLDLMRFAANSANGAWKLSSDEMANVLGAARALELRGLAPLGDAADKLSEAVRKGEIGALKDYGIAIDENLAKTDKRAAAMKAISALANESAAATDTETEAIRRHGVEFANATDKMQESIGRLVTSLTPLVGVFADLAASIADIANGLSRIPGAGAAAKAAGAAWTVGSYVFNPFKSTGAAFGGLEQGFSNVDDSGASYLAQVLIDARNGVGLGDGTAGGVDYVDPRVAALIAATEAAKGYKPAAAAKKRKPRRSGGGGSRPAMDDLSPSTWDDIEGYIAYIGDLAAEAGDLAFGGKSQYAAESAVGAIGGGARGMGVGGRRDRGPSLLERVFGPKQDFDFYATALGTLKDSVSEVYTSLVTGSESAGKALKRVVGGAIMAEGSRMAIEALKEGAYAIADLAKGNIPGAALHGKAAAGFAAGAVAAGIAAKELGAGGSSSHSGGGGGASASGVGLGSGGGGQPQIVNRTWIVGDSFGFEDPRTQARRFGNAQRRTRALDHDPEGAYYS